MNATTTVRWTFSQPADFRFWYATATADVDASGIADRWDAADAFLAANPGLKVRAAALDTTSRRGGDAPRSIARFRIYA